MSQGALLRITEDQNEYARMVSSKMSTAPIRKKGIVDIIGITSAVNWFLANKIKVNVAKSLHKVPLLLEEFKITDIYYNNYRIDVITVYREKGVKIPRIHVDFDIMPHFYLIVQVGAMLKESKILGYINPSDVVMSRKDSKFYYPTEEKLKSAEDLKRIIKIPGPIPNIRGKHLETMSLFLRFIDNELSSSYKKMLIQHLLGCETCVRKLIDVIEFDHAAKNIHRYPRTIEKYYNKFLLQKKQSANPETKAARAASAHRKNSVVGKLNKQNLNETIKENNQKQENAVLSAAQRFKKNTIDYIFRDKPDFEATGEEVIIPLNSKQKKIVTMAVSVLVLLVLVGFGVFRHAGSNPDSISNADTEYSEDGENLIGYDDGQGGGSGELPEDFYNSNTNYYNSKGNDYALASEANGEPIIATINKVSWEVPENLADKTNYKKFLQLVGKNIKLNLQNDLLLSNDSAKNSLIKVDIKFAHSGDIQSIRVSQTSGSSQIDDIIRKSVRETLSYMKPPQSGFGTKAAEITLVIEL